MKKNQGKKVTKAATKIAKKSVDKAKKLSKNIKKVKDRKIKGLVGSAKKRIDAVKKQSLKTLKRAKNKVVVTEQEIAHYVQENPVKSISTVALVGLIAGFLSRFKK